MTSNEAPQDKSDHSNDDSEQQQRPARMKQRIATTARRWGPALYTLARIVWHLATDAAQQ
ncbi:hypothetical protein O1Q96_00845 (plasmid) [Streptomyces sp. Qhu-G9]|uniref:hypothetical protein n=1 Tax=Streptomyces sp. Qhu-G9 TaxID=3452799 RepID=UPI0022AC5B95|nr:hypothetical protein [Streptomyces aurantiacus]WAU78422.1 hypothetical protein O1Q96_00845 [Streptomyces aurantiacus]